LIRIGFLTFVEEQQSMARSVLFHELSLGPYGYRSTNFSKWFSRFLVKIGAAKPLTCFHSFRHCFRDGLRESRADREISLSLGGWMGNADAAGIDRIYGDGFRPQILQEAINQINYTSLDLTHLKQV